MSTTARKTFQAAFWETEDSTSRSALLREYDNRAEAEGEIARELTRANYRVAGLYEWDATAEEWLEIKMFDSSDYPSGRPH